MTPQQARRTTPARLHQVTEYRPTCTLVHLSTPVYNPVDNLWVKCAKPTLSVVMHILSTLSYPQCELQAYDYQRFSLVIHISTPPTTILLTYKESNSNLRRVYNSLTDRTGLALNFQKWSRHGSYQRPWNNRRKMGGRRQ